MVTGAVVNTYDDDVLSGAAAAQDEVSILSFQIDQTKELDVLHQGRDDYADGNNRSANENAFPNPIHEVRLLAMLLSRGEERRVIGPITKRK